MLNSRRVGPASAWTRLSDAELRSTLVAYRSPTSTAEEAQASCIGSPRFELTTRLARRSAGPPREPSAPVLAMLKRPEKDSEKKNTLNKLVRYMEAKAAARAEAHKQARLEYEAHVAASDHVAYFSAAVPSASSTVGAHRASGNKRKAGVTLESRNVASAAGSSSGRSGTDFEAPEPEPLLRPQQPPRVSASSAFDFAGPISRDPDSSSSNSGPPSGQGRKTPRRAAAQAGVLAAGTGAGGATSSASAVPTWLPSQAPRQMSATWGLALPSYELTRRYFAARQAGLGATEAAAACLCSSDLEPTLSPNAAAPAVASQVNSSEQASCAGTRADGAASDGASSRVASTGVSVTPAMVSFVVVESAPTPILHHPHEVTTASVRCEETASENFQSAPNDIDGSKIESISGDLVGIASTRPVAGSHDSDMMAESAPEFRGPEGVSNCGVANETTSSNSASSDAVSSAS